MNDDERREPIRTARLTAQGLDAATFNSPSSVVAGLLAVQAQDVEPSMWSIGMRCDATFDRLCDAYDTGEILRTHVLRPTWHFVTPADIRWLLTVTAPRVHTLNRYMYRTLELDPPLLEHAHGLIAGTILSEGPVTRSTISDRLATGGIDASGQRLAYIMMHTELEQIVCSGPRHGRQHTYQLLDQRAPTAQSAAPADPLAELAVRFYTGHGPATVRDLANWASLTLRQARDATDAATGLDSFEHDGRTFHCTTTLTATPPADTVHLLQPYDEYLSGFSDSRTIHDPHEQASTRHYNAEIIRRGVHAGSWRRHLATQSIGIEAALLKVGDDALREAVDAAARRYAAFRKVDPGTVHVTVVEERTE